VKRAAGTIRFDRELDVGESARDNNAVDVEPSRFLCLLIAVNGEAVMLANQEPPPPSMPGIKGLAQSIGTRALGLIIEPEDGWDTVAGRPGSRSWEPYINQEIESLRSLRCRRLGLFVGSSASSNRFLGLPDVELTLA